MEGNAYDRLVARLLDQHARPARTFDAGHQSHPSFVGNQLATNLGIGPDNFLLSRGDDKRAQVIRQQTAHTKWTGTE